MAAATAIGTLVPIVPFVLLPLEAAVVTAVVIGMVICTVIAFYRAKTDKAHSPERAFAETYGVFLFSLAVTGLVTLMLGGTG